jgi:hypothetical protein
MPDSNSDMQVYPATVVDVESDGTIVINRGKLQGVRVGERLIFYELGNNNLIDPCDNEPLGKLERVKGIGKIINVQEKLSTVNLEISSVVHEEPSYADSCNFGSYMYGPTCVVPCSDRKSVV